MGTNYYARYNVCEHCKRYDQIHIGKASVGWQFTFHATEEIKSWQDWFIFLFKPDVYIFDEYNEKVTLDNFRELVASKQKPEFLNHAKEAIKRKATDPFWKDEESYLDPEGYSMSPGEFC